VILSNKKTRDGAAGPDRHLYADQRSDLGWHTLTDDDSDVEGTRDLKGVKQAAAQMGAKEGVPVCGFEMIIRVMREAEYGVWVDGSDEEK
jgi:hypothetical protein